MWLPSNLELILFVLADTALVVAPRGLPLVNYWKHLKRLRSRNQFNHPRLSVTNGQRRNQ
jgi:hypothetical protein